MQLPIEIEIIRLKDGNRMLRFSNEASGLSLEKKLDPEEPVVKQKVKWRDAFIGFLNHELAEAN